MKDYGIRTFKVKIYQSHPSLHFNSSTWSYRCSTSCDQIFKSFKTIQSSKPKTKSSSTLNFNFITHSSNSFSTTTTTTIGKSNPLTYDSLVDPIDPNQFRIHHHSFIPLILTLHHPILFNQLLTLTLVILHSIVIFGQS